LPPIICKFCVATAFFSSILALVWTQALNRRFSAGFSDIGSGESENLAVPLDQPLSDWFAVNIKVRGEAASIQINGKPVFHAESFLKNPTGKIGFRNSGNEKALIRKVWVTLLT
jgi:hypothetical protein